ncbi:MAG: hypothetical protein H6Q89_678 [Myxococcaceae bacterium]|nr:hypothetical protein [Myxococcaceae bacterium]
MRELRAAIAAAVILAASCGPNNQTITIVGPTGGEVCLDNQRVCIIIPPGALELAIAIKIVPTGDVPAGAYGEGYEIGPTGTEFLKPAKVIFKIDSLFEEDSGVDPLLLRLYTRYEGADWQPLATPVPPLDRVRRTLSGTVDHLSPFVILRADRLPDGGIPIEIDGGTKDAGVIVIPYFDAGRPDAGRPDAGRPDAGTPDAGTPDAGTPDAGKPDAGPPDAGPPDAGPPDAGPPDAGPPDAGPPDAGPPDAGPPDAGPPDAGPPDAGPPDAGEPDAGPPDAGEVDAGDPDAGADAGDGG